MAYAKQAPDVRVPGPIPTEIYRPGDVVRMRLNNAPPQELLKLLDREPQLRSADLVIRYVIRKEGLFDLAYLYELRDAFGHERIEPAEMVYRVHAATLPQPDVTFADIPDDQGVADDDTPLSVSGEPAGIVWQTKKNAAGWESACGRFELAPTGILWKAHDYWTGEATSSHYSAIQFAKDWCAKRTEGIALDWRVSLGGYEAVHKDIYFTVAGDEGRRFGLDGRFLIGEPQHRSPAFKTPDEAKAWCAIRAACKLAKTEGSVTRLEYVAPPPPF